MCIQKEERQVIVFNLRDLTRNEAFEISFELRGTHISRTAGPILWKAQLLDKMYLMISIENLVTH
jgi:hypothetical protein